MLEASRAEMQFILLVILCTANVQGLEIGFTQWTGRSLLEVFSSYSGGCAAGPQQENTQETMLNGHDWWESNWGRMDDAWPRRGTAECWANRGSVCPLPDQDHVVCLPGSRRGSTISRGWALDPKSQACKPGVHCLYACEPGYYWTAFNQAETSNYDAENGHGGNCDGTWDYGTSTHGILCKEDGTLDMPTEPLCKLGETFVFAENRLDKHIFLCQTVFPGHEIFLIPTLVRAGETVMITTQPISAWHGPSYPKPPHGDIYVSFAGADIMEACTWDGFSPSGAALLPYEIGSGVEDKGDIYSTHYFYQQPNSEVPASMVGYTMDLECESSVAGVCGNRVAHNNVVTLVTNQRPPPGTTKVKFVFKPPEASTNGDYMYTDPSHPHMPDPTVITGLSRNANEGYGSATSIPETTLYTPSEPSTTDTTFTSETTPTEPYSPESDFVTDTTFGSDDTFVPDTSTPIYSPDTIPESPEPKPSYSYEPRLGSPEPHGSYSSSPTFTDGDSESYSTPSSDDNDNPFGTTSDHTGHSTDYSSYGYGDDSDDNTPVTYYPSTSSDSQSSGYSPFSSFFGRKLLQQPTVRVFVENMLTVPVVVCEGGHDRLSLGMSVSPGEIVQLPREGMFLVGLKGDSWMACSQRSQLPWIIDMDSGSENQTFAFRPHPQTGLLDQHLLYSIQLKCTSENDACTSINAQSIMIHPGLETEAIDILFKVKKLKTALELDESGKRGNEWANSLAQCVSYFFNSFSSS